MKKTIKILTALSLLVLISILILVVLSPYLLSSYKEEITKYLTKNLHRKVEVNKISLSFLPGPGLSVKGIKVYNKAGFKNALVLDIDALNLSIAFWPLLQQRIESEGIFIKNPRLFIEKNSKGISNLAFLDSPPRVKTASPINTNPEILPGIRISRLLIANGTFSEENDLKHEAVSLKGIDIDLTRLEYQPDASTESLPAGITVGGFIKIGAGKINQFDFEQLNGQIAFEKMILNLRNWKADSYGGTIKGDLTLDLNRKLPWYHFSGKTEKLNLQPLLNSNT
ncbi:MAG: AsmA family protein, partial [Nitrospiria bacterium]